MAEKKRRKGWKVFSVFFLICVSFLLTFFIYHSIRFSRKVAIFNNRIQIGMNEEEVINLLGTPSYRFLGFSYKSLAKELKLDQTEFDKFIYLSTYTLHDDLILYFDAKTKTLIHKDKAMVLVDS